MGICSIPRSCLEIRVLEVALRLWPLFGGEHLGSPVRSPERTGESCIRPLCSIRAYAQKLRLYHTMSYAFRRTAQNPIRAYFLMQKHHRSNQRTPPTHQIRHAPSSETMHGPMGLRGVQAFPYRRQVLG
ncbi:MAG: hypothetical protein BECKG1743F_GA0114225_101036 [Candidatus Kentron sp. G]|nr:MAG: hypothetical protein BECKG1743F_GA0114225_101036 [Candidatus Kentron sp. G]VFM96303.1 MAG: hypothetical protein BECKG1743E_GA0114224_100487 [Candidatus Kentron sp. G]